MAGDSHHAEEPLPTS